MDQKSSKKVLVSKFSDIDMVNVEWLWPDRIPRGKITVMAGNPGLGKSQITAFMAAVVTGKADWPDCKASKWPSHVLFLSAEDDPSDTIKPRLVAAGANPEYCHVLKAVQEKKEEDKPETTRSFQLATDIENLADAVDSIGNVGLIVIDPISAYMGEKDSNNNSAVRNLLMPLTDLAAKKNVAVVLVTHLNKSKDQDAIGRVIGSIGLIAAARAGYAIVKDEQKPEVRYFLSIKNNIGNDKDGFSFHIEEARIIEYFIETSKVVWHPELVEAHKILSPESGQAQTQTSGAKGFLLDFLSSGEKTANEVLDEADGAGYSKPSIQRAARALGVKRRKNGMEGGWSWFLPNEVDQEKFI